MSTVAEIAAALDNIEVAVERLNEALSTSPEFAALQAKVVWWQDGRPPADRASIEQFMRVYRSYHSIWNLLTRSPIAAVTLVPVMKNPAGEHGSN